jgi:predicted RNase H-like HicB family nuclease
MKTYDLYLDSGPMRKKTFVHVPQLLGCIGRGDTTEEAIERAPDAVRTFLHFIARNGEPVDPDAKFAVRVAEHVTDGQMPGQGIGFLPTDATPLTVPDSDALMQRLAAIHAGLRDLTGKLTPKQLDAMPPKGRPIRRILAHVCGEGAYLRGIEGSSRIHRLVDEGKLDAHDALDQLWSLERDRLHAMTKDERGEVIQRGQMPWSARSAVRRMLEHGWEHYVEIAERLKTNALTEGQSAPDIPITCPL